MSKGVITVLFSCRVCGLKDVECQVRAREKDENVARWVQNTVVRAIATRHLMLSLLCEATQIDDLKIPIDNSDPDVWIGKETDIIPPKGSIRPESKEQS